MEAPPIIDRLLKNMTNMHELGRERAFELGNPFYGRFEEDGDYWRKELPSGEIYLVSIEVLFNEYNVPIDIQDTIIKRINA